MLRGLVLLLLIANVVLFFWIRSDPAWTQADREPQRLGQQVAPQRVIRVPDPASRPAAARPEPVALPVDDAASAASPASAPASGVIAAVATGATATPAAACLESAPMSLADATALQRSLAGAGVPARAVSVQADPQTARWMVYMGRFADATQAQHKADELRNLKLEYAPVGRPAALAPGLSLGVFTSQANAEARLDDLARRGVHTARVVPLEGDATARRVQVKPVDEAWRSRLPADRFTACASA